MTPLGRAEMVRRIVEEGRPVAEVAAGFGIGERTARKWVARFRSEGAAGPENRSSRPASVANRTEKEWCPPVLPQICMIPGRLSMRKSFQCPARAVTISF